MDNNGFNDLRLFYTKTGSAKYISHLDVMRAFQRAFKRARIPVWYTEGFHPHLYLTFALPLSLGYESECESVDFRVTEELSCDEILSRLRASLPVDFKALSIAKPAMPPQDIRSALYEASFTVPGENEERVRGEWERCFSASEVNVLKRTKHGEKTIDIKPSIALSELTLDGDRYSLTMRLASGNELNINPSLVFEAFKGSSGMEAAEPSVRRKAIYNEKGENFR